MQAPRASFIVRQMNSQDLRSQLSAVSLAGVTSGTSGVNISTMGNKIIYDSELMKISKIKNKKHDDKLYVM